MRIVLNNPLTDAGHTDIVASIMIRDAERHWNVTAVEPQLKPAYDGLLMLWDSDNRVAILGSFEQLLKTIARMSYTLAAYETLYLKGTELDDKL